MDANPVLTHGGTAFAVIYVLQKLKKADWFPLLKAGQAWVTRAASITVALGVGLGISYEWNPASHALLITGLSWGLIAPKLMTVFVQYATQESGYQVLQGIQAAQSILRYIESGLLPATPPIEKVTAEAGQVAASLEAPRGAKTPEGKQ
jgi:hypothetical protein